ncbi:MAG: hypothetical protein U0271_00645 [Polyangiaceae bacterium]
MDDVAAQYPIVVDPLIVSEIGHLELPGYGFGGALGSAIGISADKTRILLGAPSYDLPVASPAGGAVVMFFDGVSWSREALLTDTDPGSSQFGNGVALAEDGSRAFVTDSRNLWVFHRNGSTWTTEAQLPAIVPKASAVATNSDGRVVAIGLLSNPDGVLVFTRSGTSWSSGQLLPAVGITGSDEFGKSVAISSDGSRIIAGIPGSGLDNAEIFFFNGSTWVYEATLSAPGAATGDEFGTAVALDANGTRAVVGAQYDTVAGQLSAGSGWVFIRSGTTWTLEQMLPGIAAGERLGARAALSADGSRAVLTGFGWVGSARVFERTGTTWAETAHFEHPGSSTFGEGLALSTDGSLAAIADASQNTLAGNAGGAVSLFTPSGSIWTEDKSALAIDAGAVIGDKFGTGLALSATGQVALVGAPNDDTSLAASGGSTHAYNRIGNTWVKVAEIDAAYQSGTSVVLADPSGYAAIGADSASHVKVLDSTFSIVYEAYCVSQTPGPRVPALSGDGNYLMVGARNTGSVCTFSQSGGVWSSTGTIPAPPNTGAFGQTLAMADDGSRAIIGAPSVGLGLSSVNFYVRVGNTWQSEQQIPCQSTVWNFGWSVDMSAGGLVAAVGSPFETVNGVNLAGRVRLFKRTGGVWSEVAAINGIATSGDYFGYSVALSADGKRLLVGMPGDDQPGLANTGSVRVYDEVSGTWTPVGVLQSSNPGADDSFGASVAISADGQTALVGAPQDDTVDRDTGSATLFQLSKSLGDACSAPTHCYSGFCVDGVCCDGACAGACEACSTAAGAAVSGQCGPLSAAMAAAETCRAAASECDAAEACAPGTTTCPPDLARAEGTGCGPAVVGACDAQDECVGTSGDTAFCAPMVLPQGTECRSSISACDAPESCDGAGADCPQDSALAPGTPCGASPTEPCDAQDTCTGKVGATAVCQALVAPAGTSCRASVGECDKADVCNGSSATCADAALPVGAPCGQAASGDCNAQDTCTGTIGASAQCAPNLSPNGAPCPGGSCQQGTCQLNEGGNSSTGGAAEGGAAGSGGLLGGGGAGGDKGGGGVGGDGPDPVAPDDGCTCSTRGDTPNGWFGAIGVAGVALLFARRRRTNSGRRR